jgi:hypothetical protein
MDQATQNKPTAHATNTPSIALIHNIEPNARSGVIAKQTQHREKQFLSAMLNYEIL